MIWVTGSDGMLGRMVVRLLGEAGFPLLVSDRQADIRNIDSLQRYSAGHDITWVVNCAAYTAVDMAEDNGDEAFSINRDGPAALASLCSRNGWKLIHFSTDYVFNGNGTVPYNEDDPADPVNLYGLSKWEGEERIRMALESHYIIRISWLFGPWGKNFVSTMMRLFSERDELNVVDDQRGSPTFTKDVAVLVREIIKRDGGNFGTYHFACDGETTWHRFACEIYRLARARGLVTRDVGINPVASDRFPTRARRPGWSVMNRDRVVNTFRVPLRPWQEALGEYIEMIEKGDQ